MNPRIQFDRHPDPDALNAFAELALPVADRARVLAHLAGCSRCREVVYLAQAAAEPAPPIAKKAEPQRSWMSAFARWRIALIPAAALAATAAVVVWVQMRPAAPAPTQMATMSQPQPAPFRPDAARRPDSAGMVQQKSAPPPAGIAPRQPAAVPPRPSAALNMRLERPTQTEQKKAISAAVGAMEPNSSGLTDASAALAPPPAPNIALSSASSIAAPPPSRPELAPQPVNGLAAMHLARRVTLPSGLGAVSSAVMLNRLLAVDSAGAVFLSPDAGKHWETVASQWSGKAIQVQAPPQGLYRLRTADAAAAAQEPAPALPPPPDTAPVAAAAKPVPPAPAMLFRLVTDRHQTWVSADGKVWREP